MGMTSKIVSRIRRAAIAGLAAGLLLLAGGEKSAYAQEILLTGPLAGAPAVRKLKLYRQSRFEVAPTVTFSLLDEYQREIYFGARLNYNLTDWFAIGVWGAYGAIKIPTALSENIQDVNAARRANGNPNDINRRLTAINLGPDFTKQLGTIDWVIAPQIQLVPFRGKIALFQSLFADTDLYFFGGPAIIGVKERADCGPNTTPDCTANGGTFKMANRTAIAPTFGLGFSFFVNDWNAFSFEWRGMPFARNTGGFDNHGGGPDGKFPDYKINEDDRELKFNQMFTVSWGFYFPTKHKVSE
jgi:outer membrane beta-barrel protein